LQLSAHLYLLDAVRVYRNYFRRLKLLILIEFDLFGMNKEIGLFFFVKAYIKTFFANKAEGLNESY
jgi:hypothetical protein